MNENMGQQMKNASKRYGVAPPRVTRKSVMNRPTRMCTII
jgi:hypothetical protein